MADVDAVPNRGPELLGVNIFFLVIALTACLLRMYTRLFRVKAFGVDDGLMVLSTVCVAGPKDDDGAWERGKCRPSPGRLWNHGV